MSKSESKDCPECGAKIPAAAPAGMCPKCLLRLDLTGGSYPLGEDVATIATDPAIDLDAPTMPTGGPRGPEPLATNRPDTAADTIGPYRLLSVLGDGGMGRVFVAEQRKPIRRKVALKLVKPGMDSEEILARFAAERQAIALMDHSHIARVYDAGTTERGRPYFVMELVEGQPITDYCDTHKLTLRERLHLFAQVCRAVQHAHQKGIIHRDIKPSNILVTKDAENRDAPTPKIIDFGIAKALGPELTEETLFTLAGQVLGTPQYMSPEQASLTALDIDTRSDIYSLGVLLYELLTGRTPLEMAELRQAGLDAILQTIREQEAPKPSTRISTIDEETRTTVASTRRLPITKLAQSLRGDLDWIVMKALEKERSRRYETTNAFAEDVHRYLEDEPVHASPPSRVYLFQKFAKRNKGTLTAVSLTLASLVGGIVATTWQAREALRAQASAEELVSFMLHDLRTRLVNVGRLDVMAGVEEAVENYYGENPSVIAADESTELRAQSLEASRETLKNKGRIEEAIEAAEAALKIRSEIRRLQPENYTNLEAGAENLVWLNWLHLELIEPIPARQYAKDGLTWLDEVPVEEMSEDARGHQVELLCRQAKDLHIRQHDREKAAVLFGRAADLACSWLEREPDNAKAKLAVVTVRMESSWSRHSQEKIIDLTQTHPKFAELGSTAEMMSQIIKDDRDDFETRILLLRSFNLGASIADEESLKIALKLASSLTAHDPNNFEWQKAAASMEAEAAWVITEAKRFDDGLSLFFDSANRLSSWEREHGPIPLATQVEKAWALKWYWRYTAAGGNRSVEPTISIVDHLQEAVDIYRQAVASDPTNTHYRVGLAWALFFQQQSRGNIDTASIDLDEEIKQLIEAKELAEYCLTKTGYYPSQLSFICWALIERYLDAQLYTEARSIVDLTLDRLNSSSRHRALTLGYRAKVALVENNSQTARECLAEAVGIMRRTSENELADGYNYRDPTYHSTPLAGLASRLGKLLDSTDESEFQLILDQVDHVEATFSEIHPNCNTVRESAAATSALFATVTTLLYKSGVFEDYQLYKNRASNLFFVMCERIKRGSREYHYILHHWIAVHDHFAQLENSSPNQFTLLTEDQALSLHEYWKAGDLKASTLPNAGLANRIPWLVCHTLAKTRPDEAAHWHATAVEWLEDWWSQCTKAEVHQEHILEAITAAVAALSKSGDSSASLAAFEKEILWREQWERQLLEETETLSKTTAVSVSARKQLVQRLIGYAQDHLNTPEQSAAALQVWARVEELTESLVNDGHSDQFRFLLQALINQGAKHTKLGNSEKAVQCLTRLLSLEDDFDSKLIENLPPTYRGLMGFGTKLLDQNYEKLGHTEGQETALRLGVDWWSRPNVSWQNRPSGLEAMQTRWRLVLLHEATDRLDEPEVEQWCKEILEIAETYRDSTHWKPEHAKCQPDAERILIKLRESKIVNDRTTR